MTGINLETIQRAFNKTLAGYPVAFAYVFGSVAKGQTHKDSDLDIALGFSENISDELLLDIQAAINKALPIATNKLDIQNFTELPLIVRFRIIRDGRLLYLKDPKIQHQMALQTANFYHDEYPVLQKFNNLFLKQIANEKHR